MKLRQGRFSLAFFRRKVILKNTPDTDSIIYIEKILEIERACLQYSVKNRHSNIWQNQQIWFSVNDLISLRNLLDKLDEYSEMEDDSSSKR